MMRFSIEINPDGLGPYVSALEYIKYWKINPRGVTGRVKLNRDNGKPFEVKYLF